jgi:hypothetical protein
MSLLLLFGPKSSAGPAPPPVVATIEQIIGTGGTAGSRHARARAIELDDEDIATAILGVISREF